MIRNIHYRSSLVDLDFILIFVGVFPPAGVVVSTVYLAFYCRYGDFSTLFGDRKDRHT